MTDDQMACCCAIALCTMPGVPHEAGWAITPCAIEGLFELATKKQLSACKDA